MGPTSIKRRGIMFVLSSPSGAGKTTISRKLRESDPAIIMSVSYTTRPMRPGERDHVDYHFVTPDAFDALHRQGELLEQATVFGHRYGTPRRLVEQALESGRDVLFDIDWQGTQQLKHSAREDLVSVFILPPSWVELERRLRNRAQDSEEVVRRRMAKAVDEMSHWPEYDYILVNHDVGESVASVTAILAAERLRQGRQIGLPDFVTALGAER